MSSLIRFIQAPSNIACIKYMGKKQVQKRIPAHASISLTLKDFFISFTCTPGPTRSQSPAQHIFSSLHPQLPFECPSFEELTPQENHRIQCYTQWLLSQLPSLYHRFSLPPLKVVPYQIDLYSSFPKASGLASSAAFFAGWSCALSFSLCPSPHAWLKLWNENASFLHAHARLARQGSGSAIRSFLGPWVKWEHEDIHALSTALPPLSDLVVLFPSETKKISSSQAHQRILTSPFWPVRKALVQKRILSFEKALKKGAISSLNLFIWEEFLEMHHLFHTSIPPFSYFLPQTLKCLRWAMNVIQTRLQECFFVTVDAGPYVHLLVESHRVPFWKKNLQKTFPNQRILVSKSGFGIQCTLL